MYKYRANLVRIIDGDTIEADIDLGFRIKIRQKIRLFGINTADLRSKNEVNRQLAKAAKRRLEELLRPLNGEFNLLSHGVGKFGRCLGEIFVNEECINDILLSEGLADKYEED